MIFFWGKGKIKYNKKVKYYEQKNLQLDIKKAKIARTQIINQEILSNSQNI